MNPMGPVMSPKGPRGQTLGFLLLVTVACPWLPCEGTGYDEFLRRNVDFPKSSFGDDDTYCKEMMQGRGMMCWWGNTFLHISEGDLESLCASKGHLVAEPERSLVTFPLTVCSRTGRKAHMPCSYKGESLVKEIWITCRKGLPIHFIKHG